MKRVILLTICMAVICGRVCAQALIPFQFTSEEENRLIKETDSVKMYVASGDSTNVVSLDEESSYYKLLSRDRKVILAEGSFITDGDRYLQDGKWTERFNTGKTKQTGAYRKNLPIGTWQEYYSNGKLKQVTNYVTIIGDHGDMVYCMAGSYEEFFENGKLKTSGYYSAAITKITDTTNVDDPVSGRHVVKYGSRTEYYPEKTGHWEYYLESGELDKKEDL